jgi:putative membrane protein
MEWRNLYRGALMGAIEAIPGISAGTIAILLGIYERLIEAINGFFSRQWKKQLGFLIPLGIGMVISLFAIARVIEWLFINHPTPTQFFFMGLILGVLPFLLHKADAKNTFKGKHIGFMLIGVAIVSAMGFFSPNEGTIITEFSGATYVLLFVSGIIASSALILPGISGAFMLLILGVFPTVIAAVSNFHINILLVTGAGIAIGFVVMSRIVGYFLKNHYTLTFAATTGLVLGSMFVVFPGWPASMGVLFICIIAFLAGLISALLLGRLEYK